MHGLRRLRDLRLYLRGLHLRRRLHLRGLSLLHDALRLFHHCARLVCHRIGRGRFDGRGSNGLISLLCGRFGNDGRNVRRHDYNNGRNVCGSFGRDGRGVKNIVELFIERVRVGHGLGLCVVRKHGVHLVFEVGYFAVGRAVGLGVVI